MTERMSWEDVKDRQAQKDPRSATERDVSRAAASLRFDVAQLVYDLRPGAGLTQRQLADRMGTTQSVISHHVQIRAVCRALARATRWDARPFVDTVDHMEGDAVIVSYGFIGRPARAGGEGLHLFARPNERGDHAGTRPVN